MILLIKSQVIYCQNSAEENRNKEVLDSLDLIIKSTASDTVKLNALEATTYFIETESVFYYYNDQKCELSEKLLNSNDPITYNKAKTSLAGALNVKGLMYDNRGDIHNALECYEKSLKLSEEIGNKKAAAAALNNIATIHFYQGELNTALEVHFKSLKIRVEIGDKSGISYSLNNIGFVYDKQENYEKALDYYQRSLKLRQELGNKGGVANTLDNIGSIYLKQGDYEQALNYNIKSLSIRKNINDIAGIAKSFINIGNNLYQKAELEKNKTSQNSQLKLSYQYIDSGLIMAKQAGLPYLLKDAEYAVSKIDSARGNYKAALEHYKLSVLYKDSINNENTKKASIKSNLKYEFEKKEAVLNEQQEKERIIAREKDRFHQIIIVSVLAGLILVITFLVFIFKSLRITRSQKQIIEEKQKEILDSIHYAKRIQQSLMPTSKMISKTMNRLNNK